MLLKSIGATVLVAIASIPFAIGHRRIGTGQFGAKQARPNLRIGRGLTPTLP
jgi:hypothetical protein